MPITIHLIEADYPKAFPPALDEFPTVVDEEHFIDAWMLNSVFSSMLAIEQYLIDHNPLIQSLFEEDDDGNLMPSTANYLWGLFNVDSIDNLMPSMGTHPDAFLELDGQNNIEPKA
jgi:hypothetical protein